ncbi:hypothetical protein AB0K88_31160 [Streptomyces werraensis]|uniref:hypothetical protein n=1 Tax=Streptomyces werraensis TaxID=68284 RepID=UPI00341973E0
MGYELRRWLEDRLPQEISSGERVVALAIADLAWDDSRIAYGRKFMQKLLWKTGFENEAQVGKVLGKLAARGIELRVPICGADGKPLRNKRGQLVYAHRGHQRTFRIPFESEFPGRPAPYWDDQGEQSPDRDPHAWFDGERSPDRETFEAERSPAREGFKGERSPGREGYRAERSPARESMVTQAGDPIPLTTPTFPPTVTPRGTDSAGKAGSEKDDPALTAAVDFLMNLPAPWSLGRVSAKGMAPLLLEAIAEQGWQLDADLVAKLTENPNGVHRPMSVLRIRISDLPKAPQRTASKPGSNLPPWCGHCGDGNPAAEFNAKFRLEAGSKKPCPDCHPAHRTANAA